MFDWAKFHKFWHGTSHSSNILTLQSTGAPLDAEDLVLVGFVHLLEEDEGEDGVRAQPEVVRGEALPQREETLVLDNLAQNIPGSPVLRFTYGHKILGLWSLLRCVSM